MQALVIYLDNEPQFIVLAESIKDAKEAVDEAVAAAKKEHDEHWYMTDARQMLNKDERIHLTANYEDYEVDGR